jgi:hypothetical protein
MWKHSDVRTRRAERIKARLAVSLVILAPLVTATAAQAEEGTRLPETRVTATPPKGPAAAASSGSGAATDGTAQERCVDVTAGGEHSFGCINQMLKKKVDQTNPPITNIPPIDAKSSDLKTGVVNIPGVQQQYGQNFGKSAVPFRPPVTYGSPLTHR